MLEEALYSFAVLFSMVCSLVVSIIGFNLRNSNLQYKFLYLYPLASFLQNLFILIIDLTNVPSSQRNLMVGISIYIFLLVEFYILYHFFSHSLNNVKSKRVLNLIRWIYPILILTCWVPGNNPNSSKYVLYLIQAALVLFPVFLFVIELFKYPLQEDIRQVPAFWITSGVFFYFSATIPFFLMKDYLFLTTRGLKEGGIHSINQLCYAIMFLLINKGYKCYKKEIQ